MYCQFGEHCLFDELQELFGLGNTVPSGELISDDAGGQSEGREKVDGDVTDVAVATPLGRAWKWWQDWLGTVEAWTAVL